MHKDTSGLENPLDFNMQKKCMRNIIIKSEYSNEKVLVSKFCSGG